MTFIGFFKCVSKKCYVCWQNVMNNFKLKDGKSGVLGDFERKAINELYCFLIQICFTILFSAVGVTNLFLTKNCVADL